LQECWAKPQKMYIPKSEIRAAMFKYDPCVYETYNHYPHYLRIYFDDYPYLTYAHRAVYWTIALLAEKLGMICRAEKIPLPYLLAPIK